MTHCEIGYCVMSVSLRFVSLKAKYMRVMFEGGIDLLGLAVVKVNMVGRKRDMGDSETGTGSSRKKTGA